MCKGIVKSCFFAFLMLTALSFLSCEMSEARDYREKGFTAVVTWESDGGIFEARARVSEANNEGERQVIMELTSPETVRGFSYGYTYGGDAFCQYRDMTLKAGDTSQVIDICRMLAPVGKMELICKSESEGRDLIYASVKEPSGEICHIYLDSGTYFPTEIHKGELKIRISDFSAYERGIDENTFGNIDP